MNEQVNQRSLRSRRPTCGTTHAIPGPAYQLVKMHVLQTIEQLRVTNPEAAAYLVQHIAFDDAREMVEYTGADFPDMRLN